jgi:hypothetical protein
VHRRDATRPEPAQGDEHPKWWAADRVAEIIDGDDDAVPAGLDPEAIAAARRIARRLRLRGNG